MRDLKMRLQRLEEAIAAEAGTGQLLPDYDCVLIVGAPEPGPEVRVSWVDEPGPAVPIL